MASHLLWWILLIGGLASSTTAVDCPKDEQSEKPCVNGLSILMTKYYSRQQDGSCLARFKIAHNPCGTRPEDCPTLRTVEPGACKGGKMQVLIAHYEFSRDKGKCVLENSYITKPCSDKKPDENKCQPPQYHQGVCVGGYRSVTKYSWERNAEGECKKQISLKKEACAKFHTTEICPKKNTVEKGPCRSNGYREDLIYSNHRTDEGQCVEKTRKELVKCGDPKQGCPATTEMKETCKGGLAMTVETYYKKDKNGICVKLFKMDSVPCGNKPGVCPVPRVYEPGVCIKGQMQVLIEHYEYHYNLAKCVLDKSFLTKNCTVQSAAESENPEVGVKCSPPKYHQEPCLGAYRNVIKFSYEPDKSGTCIKQIRLEKEACAKFHTPTNCPKKSVVEKGPCLPNGYRTDATYSYMRNRDQTCVETISRKLVPCGSKPTECPSPIVDAGTCMKGVSRTLTTYYKKDDLGHCLQRYKFGNEPCGSTPQSCATVRTLEAGNCRQGRQEILIAHYEFSTKLGKCVYEKTVIIKACGEQQKKLASAASQGAGPCPAPQYHQQPCVGDFRNVLKNTYTADKDGKCMEHIHLERESCAKFHTTSMCSEKKTIEKGPCREDGYRDDIIYTYKRQTNDQCVQETRKVMVGCKPVPE